MVLPALAAVGAALPAIGKAALPGLISAGASWLAGRGQANAETKLQRTQRKLIDQLIGSLNGNGPYSDLFDSNPETFQKSFVEPAQALFRNQVAPQIQQQYIAGGQQRGTGLDDTLTRAGVDLDSMLNQHLYQFQQDSLNRKQSAMNSILSSGSGAPNQTTGGQDAISGLAGYASSKDFSDQLQGYLNPKTTAKIADKPDEVRAGFADA